MQEEGSEPPDGPWVAAAFFCERAILDQENVISATRIIDQYNIVVPPELDPADQSIPPPSLHLYAVVIVRPGAARGEQEIRIDALSSTGEMVQQWRNRWTFTDEVGGGQALVDLTVLVRHEGTMRWDVYLNDRLLTRMPLRVVFLRRGPPNGQQPQA